MCFVLYMASDRDRPPVTWDDAKPAFHVMADDPDAERVRGQFAKKNVYYLGSDNGCGCGFQRENDWLSSDPKERASKQQNQKLLAGYLAGCLNDEDGVELFGCWSGDEQETPVRRREISVSDLLGEEFFFIEKEHILVTKTAATLQAP